MISAFCLLYMFMYMCMWLYVYGMTEKTNCCLEMENTNQLRIEKSKQRCLKDENKIIIGRLILLVQRKKQLNTG